MFSGDVLVGLESAIVHESSWQKRVTTDPALNKRYQKTKKKYNKESLFDLERLCRRRGVLCEGTREDMARRLVNLKMFVREQEE